MNSVMQGRLLTMWRCATYLEVQVVHVRLAKDCFAKSLQSGLRRLQLLLQMHGLLGGLLGQFRVPLNICPRMVPVEGKIKPLTAMPATVAVLRHGCAPSPRALLLLRIVVCMC